MIDYWDDLPDQTTREKMEGLAFSILTAIDGCAVALPPFIVAELIEDDDTDDATKYQQLIKRDIGGDLHERFFPMGKKRNHKNN